MKNPDLNPNIFTDTPDLAATRAGYGEGLLLAGEANQNIVALSADLVDSTKTGDFAKKFPDRFFETGIAEQNMAGMAAGLAMGGKIPFIASYAVFSPGRNWDQLRVSCAYSDLHVVVVGAHSGLSVGPDGATHQALEDIAMVRALPNTTIIQPCDSVEAKKATMAAAHLSGVVYLRLTREPTPVITTESTPFVVGKATVLRRGTDVTLVACGPLLFRALQAAEELEKDGISAEVINNHTIKPLDDVTLTASFRKTGAVVTVEEHQIIGGLHGAIAELAAQELPVPIEPVGMPNKFGESGEPDQLFEKYGMTVEKIIAAAKRAIDRKDRSKEGK